MSETMRDDGGIAKTEDQIIAELAENEILCKYCLRTDYGERKGYSTPNGYYSCEGAYCGEAYDAFVEEGGEYPDD